jgi:hypothetical protein
MTSIYRDLYIQNWNLRTMSSTTDTSSTSILGGTEMMIKIWHLNDCRKLSLDHFHTAIISFSILKEKVASNLKKLASNYHLIKSDLAS